MAYYVGEAQYHIAKDWGGGSHGDGIMYHGKLARDGTLYLTRSLTDILWAAMNANNVGAWVCVDSTYGQPLSDAQRAAMPAVERYMLAAIGHGVTITGHGLLRSFQNDTDCPGPEILAYLRANGNGQVL